MTERKQEQKQESKQEQKRTEELEQIRIVPTMGTTNCGARCRLLVTEKDGEILSIKGDPSWPDRQPCIRGRNCHKTFLGTDRLTTPLRRIGKRGEGRFERISWEEAIDTIVSEWVRIRDTYGPSSRYVNYAWGIEAVMNGMGLARRLLSLDGGYLGFYNTYSNACTNCATEYLYGTKFSGSTYDTLTEAKLILLWAHNPAETQFDNLMYWLRQAKKQGAEIVVIDPRRSATVTALGAEWISIRPTTDAALMDAMAYVIWKEDRYDHFFVEERCLGFDRYFDYLSGKEDGIEKTPQWAADITGLEAARITELARRYASAKPAALLQGYGGQRHENGEQFTRGGIMLACLTGNVGVRGGWAAGAGHCHTHDHPSLPAIENPVKAEIPTFLWTDAVLNGKEERNGCFVQGTDVFDKEKGLRGADRLECGIKMILNLAGNCLINQHGDINRTKRILEDESLCEFIVCSDLFLTPSAKYADILLPGVSFLECDNIAPPWNVGDFLGFVNPVVPPVGESRFEFDWLYEVADRLGLADAFSDGHETYQEWLRDLYEEARLPGMDDYDTVKREGICRYPTSPSIVAFEAQRQGSKMFPTKSGKVEIWSASLEELHHPEIPPVPSYIEAKEGPGKSADYPLQMISYYPVYRTHSVHYNNQEFQKKFPQKLWIHPQDAAARCLLDGDAAEVWNDRGRMIVPVKVTEQIMAGVVAAAQGAWYQADETGTDVSASINVLTSSRPTPLAKGNPQQTNLVEVRKLSGNCNK